jgi:RNA recognition motif-containing protein
VAQFIPKEQRQQGVRKFTNIYVSGFPESWTEETFKEHFEKAGKINSIHLSMKEGRPFGFANFPNEGDAAKAVELYNDHKLDENNTLYVARAMKKTERAKVMKEKFEKMK